MNTTVIIDNLMIISDLYDLLQTQFTCGECVGNLSMKIRNSPNIIASLRYSSIFRTKNVFILVVQRLALFIRALSWLTAKIRLIILS
jgi:hypothetical protein